MTEQFGPPSEPEEPTQALPPPDPGVPSRTPRAEDVLPPNPWSAPNYAPAYAYTGANPWQSSTPPAASNGLAVSGMVLGILAACFFWVPFLNLILAVLASALGGTGWAKANKTGVGKGQAITGTILGVIVLAAGAIFMVVIFSAASAGAGA